MKCEVLAVGTELLLGPSVDTNSTWIGERLAENGIDSFFHTVVGDNHGRIVEAIKLALKRADALIVTGGLGPTQDDITREAAAEVMGDKLVHDEVLAARIAYIFESRGRSMAKNNLRQAQRPASSAVIEQRRGTAPGLICPVGDKVLYLLPGVPHEMKEMMERAVLPDLRGRAGVASSIVSRFVRTWGVPESTLAELVGDRVEKLDANGGNPTLAFLAHGLEGVHLRITAKAESQAAANEMLDAEEAELRAILGPLVFGIDDQTMEAAVGNLLVAKRLSLGVAESLTGGLIAARLTEAPGGSAWLKGGIVSYASKVKFSVLDVPEGPVVSAVAAKAMAEGVRKVLDSDIGIAVTGVAGPGQQEGQPVGTVFGGIALPWAETEAVEFHLSGDRKRVREFACINVLDVLRRRLLVAPAP